MKFYDVVVLGGGAAGLTSAKLARGFGKSVALIEKERLGGECTWSGCVPSKALIKVAQVACDINNAEKFGLKFDAQVKLDTHNVMDHVRSVVKNVYRTHTPEAIEKLGIDLYFGDYQFQDSYTLVSEKEKLRAKKIIIATGSSPFIPPITGLDQVDFLTNQNLFELKKLPKSLVILGGGAIGAEMASALQSLGVRVTLIEMNDRMLVHDDYELVKLFQDDLRERGVQLKLGLTAREVKKSEQGVSVICSDQKNNDQEFMAEQLLIAVGRKPNCTDLNLEKAGIAFDQKKIIVNKFLQTSVKHIFACGDVVGPYQFSHMAFAQAVAAGKNSLLPFKKKIIYDQLVWVTFTDPELASMGLNQEQAQKLHGDSIVVHSIDYKSLDRAQTECSLLGKAKFVCTKKGEILGAQILGPRAGEIIHEVQLAKVKGVLFHELASVIHAYPTFSELVWHASKKAYVQKIQSNIFVKIAQWFFKKR